MNAPTAAPGAALGVALGLLLAACAASPSTPGSELAATTDAVGADAVGAMTELDQRSYARMDADIRALDRRGVLRSIANLPRGGAIPTDGPPVGLALQYAEQAVVVVARLGRCPDCGEDHVTFSSGFLVSSAGTFFTSAHVAGEGDDRDRLAVVRRDGSAWPVTALRRLDLVNDVAIGEIGGAGHPTLALRSGTAPIAAGAPVRVIGHPASHFYLHTAGIVARAASMDDEVPELMVTAGFAYGSSGAPVLDGAGRVVGMVASTRSIYSDDAGGGDLQMVLRYCVPGAVLRHLLEW